MTILWTEGDDHGLVWPHGMAVLDAQVPLPAVVSLWKNLRGGGDLRELLRLLTTDAGFDVFSLPGFALALRSGEGWQLAARAGFEVRVGSAASVSGTSVSTWTERYEPEGSTLVLGRTTSEESGDRRPIEAGIVRAGVLVWGDMPIPAGASPVSVVLPLPGEQDVAQHRPDIAGPRIGIVHEAQSRGDVTATEEEADELDAVGSPDPGPQPESGAEELAEPGNSAVVSRDLPQPEPGSGRFASQYDRTQMHSVEEAAIRSVEVDGMIASVPRPSGGLSTSDRLGDHDDNTVIGDPGAVAPSSLEHADGPVGPLVLGRECANGHANPPERTACGVCHGELGGEPRQVPRPSLGRLLLPNGEVLELTSPVIFGRNPRADRVQGALLPRLVPLSQGHISGTHLAIRLEQWNILAVDLDSRNGTFLRRHGAAPFRLGERPEPLIEGDVLDLGHGVQVRLEFKR